MKRLSFALMVGSVLLFLFTHTTRAAELVTNGGFETGNFTGWTAVTPATFFRPWAVSGSGAGGNNGGTYVPYPTATVVQQGSFNAWNGIAAGANQSFLLYQDITIPTGFNVRFTWNDRYQMNYTQFCSTGCGTATYAVEVLTTANVLRQTLYIVNTLTNTNTNTGFVNHSVDLTSYQGQTIRIRFRTTTTQSLQGPGQLEIDAVSVQTLQPTAALVSITGRVLSADGMPISRASLTLTDASGTPRTATTTSFGYYHFDDVEPGHSYVIAVYSKRYDFPDSPRLVSPVDNVSNLDFVASP
ncbi:MAG TPA: carboxypeptidase-like regulatory domain-containing protein [Pyrinomonadaceae bacterium]|nr:carboxypeptidase-like regulatory domain-containing protein [Pyrinomonadaceae bacterium]